MNILLIPSEKIEAVDRLSVITKGRCDVGLRLWRTGYYNKVLVTGGLFLSPELQKTAAASLMCDYLIDQGVPAHAIVVEDKSLDTFENISLGIRALESLGINGQITVVTQYQHAMRFWITFRLAHGIHVKIIPIRQPVRFLDWCLEWLVLIPYHLLDWHGKYFLAKKNREQRQRNANM